MSDITKKINLNIKVDPKLKAEADTAFKGMGMNTSVAINMFLTRVVEDGEFPFIPRYNKETSAAIEETKKGDLKKSESIEGLFKDLDED